MNNVKSNRQQRRSADVYRVVPLYESEDRKKLEPSDQELYIVGELGEHLVVSVPETTSAASAQRLTQAIWESEQRKTLVITHNVTFLKIQKCSASESAKIVKIAEEGVNDEEAGADNSGASSDQQG
jgi:hypothetical protein